MNKYSCILLTSDHEQLAPAAEAHARRLFDVRHVSRYARGARELDSRVTAAGTVDFLFNFVSPVILPARVLKQAARAAINFHPAPPKWPGVGSASLALFDKDRTFGATAHLMIEQVDAGPILRTIEFPIERDDTCERLFNRALDGSLALFRSLLVELSQGAAITPSGQTWARHAVRRAEFEQWMRVSIDDAPETIRRKARALAHPRLPGPYIELAGLRFHVLPGTPLTEAA